MKNQTATSVNQEIIPDSSDSECIKEVSLLAPYWKEVHEKLFPFLEVDGSPPLTGKLRTLAQVLEIVRLEEFVAAPEEVLNAV